MNEQFTTIKPSDGTCILSICSKPGRVLAYDISVPEIGYWFCEECWPFFAEVPFLMKAQEKADELNERQRIKRVHENLKQLTFTQSDDVYHPLHIRLQTPDGVDIGLWLDRWQTVDVVVWLQALVSRDTLTEDRRQAESEAQA